MVGGGLLGAAITAPIVDKTGWHVITARTLTPILAACFIALVFAGACYFHFVLSNELLVQPNDYAGLLVIFAVQGAVSFALLPVALELGAEITYPCPEAISSGLLWMFGQFFAIIIQLVMNALRAGSDGHPPNNMFNALVFGACFASSAALIALFCIGGPLKRRQAQGALNNRERVMI